MTTLIEYIGMVNCNNSRRSVSQVAVEPCGRKSNVAVHGTASNAAAARRSTRSPRRQPRQSRLCPRGRGTVGLQWRVPRGCPPRAVRELRWRSQGGHVSAVADAQRDGGIVGWRKGRMAGSGCCQGRRSGRDCWAAGLWRRSRSRWTITKLDVFLNYFYHKNHG